jgi:putative redox protein
MDTATAGERVVIVEGDASGFAQHVTAGDHAFAADEPLSAGGTNTGPDPYQLILAALGACTSMTVAMYARRKGWPLTRVRVQLAHSKVWVQDCADSETKDARLDRIDRVIGFEGDLGSDQRQRLIDIAEKCPVHRTLTSGLAIVTRQAENPLGVVSREAAPREHI